MIPRYEEKVMTFSSLYIRPMITDYKTVSAPYYNTYIRADDRPEYNQHIFIVLYDEYVGNSTHEKLMSHPNLVERYMPIDGFAVYVFKVPEEFVQDYQLFIKGKYSKFSEKLKKAVIKDFDKRVTDPGYKGEYWYHYKALFPDETARRKLEKALGVELEKDAEVYPIPNIPRETLSHDKLVPLFDKSEEGQPA